jgi:hypothetical protein
VPKEMEFLKATHSLPLYLAHRMSEVKDGTSRQTDASYLEDVSRPHRRRKLRVALSVLERALITLITLKSMQLPIICCVAPSLCYLWLLVMVSVMGNGARTAWDIARSRELEKKTPRPCFTS